MKVVEHDFDSNRNGLEVIAKALGGVVDGYTVKGNNELYKGIHSILLIEEEEIAVMVIDVCYKQTMFLKHKNKMNNDFVVLHFYLFDSDVDFFLNNKPSLFGKLDYNFLMVDGLSNIDYIVKKNTNSYGICVIIGKTTLRQYLSKICEITDDIFVNTKMKTIINVDRMNYESLVLINNFRKISRDDPFYEMSLKALVYALINNYIEQLKTKKMITGEIVSDDVKRIIISKEYLQNNNEALFPGIDFLSTEALMSVAKYKKMFAKIIGLSPAVFFYNSKLEKAKELLETKQYTIGEISDKLNYSSVSYLAKKFSKIYGVSPKEYQSLL